ncbi:MAG: GGDEF domain-containing protein [Rhizobiaceae bacterium]
MTTQSGKSALMLMLNTILFGTGAGLVTLAWMQAIKRNPGDGSAVDAMFNMQEPLLLMTVAILLGGVFHSFTILYPALIEGQEKRLEAQSEADDYKDQAHRDPLTNLHNRRYFDATLEAYFYEFNKMKLPFGLLIFDVDHFKSVNDDHGHSVGDKVLKDIADCARSLTREHDVIARIGGEEFAVIIAQVTEDQLKMIAERYRERIARLEVSSSRKKINPTISIGAALSTGHDNIHSLLEAADERLYAAKDMGRNQVVNA